ncbi:MAG: chloride channel protein [Kofleriaceae bacterium]|nr:chloride channel protein [Kofleriaceae bacterium]
MERDDRRRRYSPHFVVALFAVALIAGAFAIAFRATLAFALRAVAGAANVVDAMAGAGWYWRLLVPMLGAAVAGLLSLAIAKRGGGGVSDVMEAVALGRGKLSLAVTTVKSAASWFAIVCGGSIGREGPLIQFGGASGYAVSTRFGLSADDRRVLVAAGTAAGFAAAYNTPLAAVAFVLEIVAGIVVIDTIVPMLVATVIATMLTRAFVGAGPIYHTRAFVMLHAGELAAFALVAIAAGLAGFAFTRLVALGEHVFHRRWLAPPWRQALGGLGAGAIIVFVPTVAGNGYEPLDQLLDGTMVIRVVAILLVAKALATTSSVASGSPGGIFTPTLLVGGCTGYLVGYGLAYAGLDVGPPGGYALVGMAAAIAAATHAPFMAAILAFELSGDYAVVLPLVLATAIATALARALGRDSIYMAELRARGVGWELTMAGRELEGDDGSG